MGLIDFRKGKSPTDLGLWWCVSSLGANLGIFACQTSRILILLACGASENSFLNNLFQFSHQIQNTHFFPFLYTGFRRKEFRGKLAIAITANFINRNSTAEAKVEEISGVAFIFNQKFFQDLKEETGETVTFLQTRPLSMLPKVPQRTAGFLGSWDWETHSD